MRCDVVWNSHLMGSPCCRTRSATQTRTKHTISAQFWVMFRNKALWCLRLAVRVKGRNGFVSLSTIYGMMCSGKMLSSCGAFRQKCWLMMFGWNVLSAWTKTNAVTTRLCTKLWLQIFTFSLNKDKERTPSGPKSHSTGTRHDKNACLSTIDS